MKVSVLAGSAREALFNLPNYFIAYCHSPLKTNKSAPHKGLFNESALNSALCVSWYHLSLSVSIKDQKSCFSFYCAAGLSHPISTLTPWIKSERRIKRNFNEILCSSLLIDTNSLCVRFNRATRHIKNARWMMEQMEVYACASLWNRKKKHNKLTSKQLEIN